MADSTSKTVRVRVAVVVDPDGNWRACGVSCSRDSNMERVCNPTASSRTCFIEADVPLPLPSAPTVEGEVAGEERA